MKPRCSKNCFRFCTIRGSGHAIRPSLSRRPWYEWNPSDIDDMVDQVGLQLHELQQQGKIRTTLPQVLRGIASNVVNSEIRKRTGPVRTGNDTWKKLDRIG